MYAWIGYVHVHLKVVYIMLIWNIQGGLSTDLFNKKLGIGTKYTDHVQNLQVRVHQIHSFLAVAIAVHIYLSANLYCIPRAASACRPVALAPVETCNRGHPLPTYSLCTCVVVVCMSRKHMVNRRCG